jgi:orotate phosphoribosyltransferase
MFDYQKEFIVYALACGVLKFGEFRLKSGRLSPYFFNTGLFDTGAKLGKLGEYYASALIQSGLQADMLYGPAYKGIPLACSTAMAYARLTGGDMPFAFNRKEAKNHGEGGVLIGTTLTGNIVMVDDVITAGISVRESVQIITGAGGARLAGVLIALDRQEQGLDGTSAIAEVYRTYGIPVMAIVTLTDIIAYLAEQKSSWLSAIEAYRKQYGI